MPRRGLRRLAPAPVLGTYAFHSANRSPCAEVGAVPREASLHQPVFAIAPYLGVEPIPPEEWVREQADDDFCRTAPSAVGIERTRFAILEGGVLVRIGPLDRCSQIFVPQALKRSVLQIKNEPTESEHAGAQRLYEALRRGLYCPWIVPDYYHTVQQCPSCAWDRIALRKRTTPLTLFPARAPLESVELDLLGSVRKSRKGLIHSGHGRSFLETVPVPSDAIRETRKGREGVLHSMGLRFHGPQKTLLTDSRPQLTAKLFLETGRVPGVRNVFTSKYHP